MGDTHAEREAVTVDIRVTIKAAYYTDICGIPLKPNGSAALKGDGSENLEVAAKVVASAMNQPTTTSIGLRISRPAPS